MEYSMDSLKKPTGQTPSRADWPDAINSIEFKEMMDHFQRNLEPTEYMRRPFITRLWTCAFFKCNVCWLCRYDRIWPHHNARVRNGASSSAGNPHRHFRYSTGKEVVCWNNQWQHSSRCPEGNLLFAIGPQSEEDL
jgi:hypothetical protein